MKLGKVIRRFCVPRFVVTFAYWSRSRCFVSPRAEVEWTSNLTIGRKTQISSFCKIKASDGPITIGDFVSVGPGTFLSSHTAGINIGNDSMIGPNVTIVAGNYNYDKLDEPIRVQGYKSIGITIEENVLIGAGSIILDGSVIKSGSVITPNSVVSGTIEANSIVQGNPGKVIFVRR